MEPLYGEKIIDQYQKISRLDFEPALASCSAHALCAAVGSLSRSVTLPYGDHISLFDDDVILLTKRSKKHQEALRMDPSLANMRTAKDVLRLLASMHRAELSGGTARQAGWLTPGNLKFREAWHDSVMQLGLSLDEYATLHSFQRLTNRAFHQTSPPSQALMELKKCAVPAEYSQYKEPLIKLLEILSAAPGTH